MISVNYSTKIMDLQAVYSDREEPMPEKRRIGLNREKRGG
jgi:hypothetical protein